MFNDVQGVSIDGDAHNVVHGDQKVTTIINRIVRVERPGRTVVKKERKRHDTDSEYNQYREIIRGDINKFKQLDSEEGGWELKDRKLIRTHSYRRTVHKAQVYGDDKVYTAISYHGRDAKKIWKKEFMKCSQADDPAVLLQLFAINRSNVPTLLFHDEWLPMGHLQNKMEGTFWEGYYLFVYTGAWKEKMPYDGNRLWLNSRTGCVSSGVEGPFADSVWIPVRYNCEDMPSLMEMATADACVRFLNQTGAGHLDLDVLGYASRRYSRTPFESLFGIESPDCHDHRIWIRDTRRGLWFSNCNECDPVPSDEVQDLISKLRLDTVYSGAQLDKIANLKEGLVYECDPDVLSDQTLIDNGLTRFQFSVGFQGTPDIDYDHYIHLDTISTAYTWFSQAHRFDLPISGSETCFIPCLEVYLQLDLQPEQFGVSDLETLPIVYLFLRPPPRYVADIDSWLSRIYFWSFNENGTSEIPEMECKRLGLPTINLHSVWLRLRTWPKYVYDGFHAWQVARGFDPATADWARALGLPILEPATTRFEEVVEEEPSTCNNLPEPNADSILDDLSTNNQLSPLSTPPAARIPKRPAPKKQKRVQVIIHDTDSESEAESH